jgi:phosphoribosylformylglycinamidine cyclo-ligase
MATAPPPNTSKHKTPIAARNPNKRSPGRPGALTYDASGVSIEAGDAFVETVLKHMRRTHGPRVLDNGSGFAGLFRLDYNEKLFKRNYKDPVLVACTDGVGTKLKLATATGVYSTVGIDLVAMCVNDLIVQGAEPLFFLDYIAIPKVDQAMLGAIITGIAEGCRMSDCALLGGETAEMPGVYPEDEYDLAGFAVGVVELKRAIDPLRVEPGDEVIALPSSGVHSNGFSLVRAVVEQEGLDLGETYPELAGRTLGDVLLTPTRIYAQSIVRLLRAYRVKKVISGMAHITGGGLAGNLERALNPKVDAVIDRSAWEVPPIFTFLQDRAGIADEEMHKVFNMGVGYCLIVRPAFTNGVLARLEKMGEHPVVIGKIRKGKGQVREQIG